ncbi:hypothetical protein [Robertkochia solimangrovi]|uniref:hypothetical protein n=1 Tax=Robertkochia solimangrovi TaxID=2213046 RepID=UPI00117E577A|nr:hypothetical protein [Robertkochia solimangrovi]TRZ46149.1 hypothetical protein DMZ48_02505 [Robertkochia solimangrovi]
MKGVEKFSVLALFYVLFLSCQDELPNPSEDLLVGTITLDLKLEIVSQASPWSTKATKGMAYALDCSFPDPPTVVVPEVFNVQFFIPGESEPAYEFTGFESFRLNTFQVVLREYEIIIQTEPVGLPEYTSSSMYFYTKTTHDFSKETFLGLTVKPFQSLVVVAKNNLAGGPTFDLFDTNGDVLTVGVFKDLEMYEEEYVGLYVGDINGRVGSMLISFTDYDGVDRRYTLEDLEPAVMYRVLFCPDPSMGIYIDKDIFENVVDVIIE